MARKVLGCYEYYEYDDYSHSPQLHSRGAVNIKLTGRACFALPSRTSNTRGKKAERNSHKLESETKKHIASLLPTIARPGIILD